MKTKNLSLLVAFIAFAAFSATAAAEEGVLDRYSNSCEGGDAKSCFFLGAFKMTQGDLVGAKVPLTKSCTEERESCDFLDTIEKWEESYSTEAMIRFSKACNETESGVVCSNQGYADKLALLEVCEAVDTVGAAACTKLFLLAGSRLAEFYSFVLYPPEESL